MKINSTYKVRLKSKNHVYDKTVALYRDAVNFFIHVALENWNRLKSMDGINPKLRAMEMLTHTTNRNKPKYPFDNVIFIYFFLYMEKVNFCSRKCFYVKIIYC